ncbi:structural maintenance of chromosomes protein 6-like [Stylophora pistillata]|uniref:structural maintenance of chromosomes protein 6-like n=1 Tax=Stylophora pistillata TaxID=50429 RepID=UPI000C05096F|nr:structural maintenance of chromosomes protein 6-like [Stylophora pistillata]
MFGDWMPTLVSEIDVAVSQGRFTKPPRGPIGRHVHLKDNKWMKAIESCLGRYGSGFAVCNFRDYNVLNAIIKKCCKQFFPVVIMCPFEEKLYDVSQHKTRCEFPTVLDMVQIDDPVLANCLIDQLHIERTILIENRSHATKIIFSRNAPTKQAFTASGDHLTGGACAKSTVPVHKWRNYLSSTTSDNTSALKEQIDAQRKDCSKLAVQKKRLENNLMQKRNEQQEAFKRKKTLQAKVDNLKIEINELQESLEEAVSLDIPVLECEVEQGNQRVEVLSEQSETAQQKFAEAVALMEEQNKMNADHKNRISEALRQAEPLKEKLESLTLRKEEEKIRKERSDNKRRKFEQKIEEIKKEKEHLVHLAERKAEIASAQYIRVETSRSVQDLETEILTKEKYIRQEEKNRGKVEDIRKEYGETREKYAEILQKRKNIKRYNQRIKASMELRVEYLFKTRMLLASMTSQFFTQHLSQRGFSGYISFDHKEETLKLIVNVHKGPHHVYSEREVDESTSIMKSLSGGERSVSTISYLTALWGTMESPFRCLDEFDVFMVNDSFCPFLRNTLREDLMNRKVIMEMVLEIAKLPSQKHRQFIFLTPLDLSGMPLDKNLNIRIFEMADPER